MTKPEKHENASLQKPLFTEVSEVESTTVSGGTPAKIASFDNGQQFVKLYLPGYSFYLILPPEIKLAPTNQN